MSCVCPSLFNRVSFFCKDFFWRTMVSCEVITGIAMSDNFFKSDISIDGFIIYGYNNVMEAYICFFGGAFGEYFRYNGAFQGTNLQFFCHRRVNIFQCHATERALHLCVFYEVIHDFFDQVYRNSKPIACIISCTG